MDNILVNSGGQCAIIIPIYKSNPSKEDELSIKRCNTIFGGKRPIVILTYKGLELKNYHNLIKNHTIEYFDKRFFSGLDSYNELMLSKEFYEKFIKFEYVLIYQTDAYVFKDKLDYFISKSIKYIGAPIPSNICSLIEDQFKNNNIDFQVPHPLMNGGLSLRRVQDFLELIRQRGEIFDKLCNIHANEDIIFSVCFHSPKVDEQISSEFSLDAKPSFFYNKYGKKLPMGCHGWSKGGDLYEADFYQKLIQPAKFYRHLFKKTLSKFKSKCLSPF